MKNNFLPGPGKIAWKRNKPFVLFMLSLLIIISLLKFIFYNYNHYILFNSDDTNFLKDKIKIIKWSLWIDFITIILINAPLLLFLQLGRFISESISTFLIVPFFIVLNSTVVLLNLSDIFYFPFHFQRANADLLYVLDHPFKEMFHLNIFMITAVIISVSFVFFLIWKLHKRFYAAFKSGNRCGLATILIILGLVIFPFYKNNFIKLLVPTYPLTELNSKQLLIVQNSFHTFAYSLFRKGQDINSKMYMPVAECDSLFPIRKSLTTNRKDSSKKNIVLFIMESVPYDFFDRDSRYKVEMPFFDSILEKSTFYSNAFCYAHQSNKGITSILAGIPTLSDIPLYHSAFVNMPVTAIGTALKKNDYHSFLCIGDEFDNFGFAKCTHWLGLDNYYSLEDIPGHNDMPAHTMGVQDEYVLNFMKQKINETPAPFFAVNYNISTHYPYDLPAVFTRKFPNNYTRPMKSMAYYDHSLQHFFKMAEKEPWFRNTVFIFCSDHWLIPDDTRAKFNAITGYRIPIIIFDPSVNQKKTNTQMASQFDIMGTILAIGGYEESIISYGGNLLDSNSFDKCVYSRANSSLYQVTDSSYILGFNCSNDKVEFLYNYKTDTSLRNNLVADKTASPIRKKLTLNIKAFLQKAVMQYNRMQFK